MKISYHVGIECLGDRICCRRWVHGARPVIKDSWLPLTFVMSDLRTAAPPRREYCQWVKKWYVALAASPSKQPSQMSLSSHRHPAPAWPHNSTLCTRLSCVVARLASSLLHRQIHRPLRYNRVSRFQKWDGDGEEWPLRAMNTLHQRSPGVDESVRCIDSMRRPTSYACVECCYDWVRLLSEHVSALSPAPHPSFSLVSFPS